MRALGVLGSAVLLTAMTTMTVSPAHADDLQVLRGTGFPTADARLAYVGCQSFHGPAAPPQLRINLGPGAAPLGRRSFGLVPAGPGTATGAYVRLDSMATGTAVVPVHAAEGTEGVSWAWVRTADAPGDRAWLGRAAVLVPAGGWHRVDAATLTYSWTLVDLRTGASVQAGPPATLAGLTAAHGDGPGYAVTGLGCDGHTFNVDGVRAGDVGDVTTFDLEGMDLTTVAAASSDVVAPGEAVELTATVLDAGGRPTGDLVVLQSRTLGGAWQGQGEPVAADAGGVARVTVHPAETTDYRWFRPEGEYADEGWSPPVRVTVPASATR